MRKIIILLLMVSCTGKLYSQNNAIFYGGEGDGWALGSYLQVANVNSYKGGEGDGWSVNSYTQANNSNIHLGGEGDGWSAGSYLQAHNNTPNQGGEGDGWAATGYLPALNQVWYQGGEGDGWASNVIPLGPLPVELLSFTGKEFNDTHILDWITSMELNSSHFVVEHSINAKSFSELGMVTAAGTSAVESRYTFTNKNPVKGDNFYRLKMVDIDQQFKYSNVVLLRLLKDNNSLLIYPNPAASVLNIEMTGMIEGTPLKVEVLDASGKLVKSENYQYSNQKYTLDISAYANGLYFLKLTGSNYAELVKFSISK